MSQSLEFKIPEGYVFDKDNSTDEVIRFKPKKITYKDVKAKLFTDCKETYYFFAGNILKCFSIRSLPTNSLLTTSSQQLEQLLALNKLMNTAKYLNGDWEPDFTNRNQNKHYIYYDFEDLKWRIGIFVCYRNSIVYFKSEELARKALEILGEEEVKKALGIFE